MTANKKMPSKIGNTFNRRLSPCLRTALLMLGIFAAANFSANAQRAPKNTPGEINANPATCRSFSLCFRIEAAPDTAYDAFRSVYFYVLILQTTKKCAVSGEDLAKIQTLFPKNKVFAATLECERYGDWEKNIAYENIGSEQQGFVAVYAGKTKAEAEKFLRFVKSSAADRFPGANLRRTRVVFIAD